MSKEVIDSLSSALHQNSLLRSDVDGARSYLQAAVFLQALTNKRYLSSQYYRGLSPFIDASVLLSRDNGWLTSTFHPSRPHQPICSGKVFDGERPDVDMC